MLIKVEDFPLAFQGSIYHSCKIPFRKQSPDQEPSLGSCFSWNGEQSRLWLLASPRCSCDQIGFPRKEEAATFVKGAKGPGRQPLKPERQRETENTPSKTVRLFSANLKGRSGDPDFTRKATGSKSVAPARKGSRGGAQRRCTSPSLIPETSQHSFPSLIHRLEE